MLLALNVVAVHQAREALLGRGLAVLAAWVLLNFLVSGHHLARADRRLPAYYFHGMNVGWALVNALLAFWGIYHLQPMAPAGLQLTGVVQAQLFNETLFALNAGLDVAYIAAGYYLQARAALPDEARPARLLGFGRSLRLQGGFLLVFDAVMWSWLHWQGQGWLPFLR
jgi:hypothetical protein